VEWLRSEGIPCNQMASYGGIWLDSVRRPATEQTHPVLYFHGPEDEVSAQSMIPSHPYWWISHAHAPQTPNSRGRLVLASGDSTFTLAFGEVLDIAVVMADENLVGAERVVHALTRLAVSPFPGQRWLARAHALYGDVSEATRVQSALMGDSGLTGGNG
jgi:hypothetical protein